MVYALIKDGKIVNTIKASPEFIQSISIKFDRIINLDELQDSEKGGVGDNFSGGVISRVYRQPIPESEAKQQLRQASEIIDDAESLDDVKAILKKMAKLLLENSR